MTDQTQLAAQDSRLDGDVSLERAEKLLEADHLTEALKILESNDSSAAAALRAAAYFRMEDYARAARELRVALSSRPGDRLLYQLYERAIANDEAGVQRYVPTPKFPQGFELLAGPRPGEHPFAAPSPRAVTSLGRQLWSAIGSLGGRKLGPAFGTLVRLLGREPRSNTLWTSWYEHGLVRATTMIAARLARLHRQQLFPAYPNAEGTGFFRARDEAPPPQWVYAARTADGSWNDLSDPMAGAAGTRFGFNVNPRESPPETGPRLLTPNPRMVSRVLLTRHSGFKIVPFLNLTAAPWIQFMTNDWVSYGDPAPAEPYRIPLMQDDPARQTLRQTHMLVRPTQPDPTRQSGEKFTTHINEVTSWWDASQVYGSDAATIDSLRSHRNGKLALDPQTGNLPLAPDGVERTGFRRNWWLGLSMLHTLFAREHNAICDMLAARYPKWSDQRMFDAARLINAAVMAKIHTVEWTPAILPNEALNAAMNANWFGMLTNALRTRGERRTVTEISIADPLAGGLVGNAVDNHSVPYSLTRELASALRLHSLLPDQISLYRIDGPDEPVASWSLAELRQASSHKVTAAVSMADLFYSFGRQHPGQLVLNNYPETLQNLSVPGHGFYDLGAVDVLRDRERGVPRYNQLRRLLGLKPIRRFDDLSDDPESVKALQAVYDSVEDIDLLIGNLAEARRPTNFAFGETLFEIFLLNAARRLQADRFYTEAYREEFYTREGLAWIDAATFKSVLLRHYPKLGSTGLSALDNGFEPWDIGPLDPGRHPLRRYARELRANDAYRLGLEEGNLDAHQSPAGGRESAISIAVIASAPEGSLHSIQAHGLEILRVFTGSEVTSCYWPVRTPTLPIFLSAVRSAIGPLSVNTEVQLDLSLSDNTVIDCTFDELPTELELYRDVGSQALSHLRLSLSGLTFSIDLATNRESFAGMFLDAEARTLNTMILFYKQTFAELPDPIVEGVRSAVGAILGNRV